MIITLIPNTDTISCNQQIVLSVDVKDASGNSIPEYVAAVTTYNDDIVQISNYSKNVYYIKGIGSGVATIKVDPGCDLAQVFMITVTSPVASVVVTPSQLSMKVGDTLTLTATAKDANGNVLSGLPVTWSSDNSAVATVVNGLVTAIGVGTATITAKMQCVSGTASVTVKPPVASVVVTPSQPSMKVGDTLTLTATAKDANGNVLTGLPITWSSDNTAVATVVNGLVAAVGVGTSTITATVEGVSGAAIVTVTINAVLLSFSVTTFPDCTCSNCGPNGTIPPLFVNVGDTMQLTITATTDQGDVTQAGFSYVWWLNPGYSTLPLPFTITPDGLITYTGPVNGVFEFSSSHNIYDYCTHIYTPFASYPVAACYVSFFVNFDLTDLPYNYGFCPWIGCAPCPSPECYCYQAY